MEVWVFMRQDMVESPMADNSLEVKGVYSSKELAYSKAETYAKSNSGHWFVKPVTMDV
jgi:hypothetical protein